MRRRKAAEELKKEEGGKPAEVRIFSFIPNFLDFQTHCADVQFLCLTMKQEKKVVDESQPQKFTPLIVTEKKIISLKKKMSEGPSDQSQKPKTVALARKTALAVEHVAAQSGSQIKTTLRTSSSSMSGGVVAKKLRIDDDIDESLEDELLADSPPATPAPANDTAAALKNRLNVAATKVGDIPTSMFTNRRIVVRNNADNVPNNENNLSSIKSTSSTAGKGIFDRLDKKVISVNEAAKRKIQRIVINNSSD